MALEPGNGGRRPPQSVDETFELPWDAFKPFDPYAADREAGRERMGMGKDIAPDEPPAGWWEYERPQDIVLEGPPPPVFWTPERQRTNRCLPVIREPDWGWGTGGDPTLDGISRQEELWTAAVKGAGLDDWFASFGGSWQDMVKASAALTLDTAVPGGVTAIKSWAWMVFGGDSLLAKQGLGLIGQFFAHPSFNLDTVMGELDALNEARIKQGLEPLLPEDFAQFQRAGRSPVYSALAQAQYEQARAKGKTPWSAVWDTLQATYGEAAADTSWEEAAGFRYTHIKNPEAMQQYQNLRNQGYTPTEAGNATQDWRTELVGEFIINPSLIVPGFGDLLFAPLSGIRAQVGRRLWTAAGDPSKDAIIELLAETNLWRKLADPAREFLVKYTGPVRSATSWLSELTASSKVQVARGRALHLGQYLEFATGGKVIGKEMAQLVTEQPVSLYRSLPRWVQAEWDEVLDLVSPAHLRTALTGLVDVGTTGKALGDLAETATQKSLGLDLIGAAAGVWSRRAQNVRTFLVESWLFSRPAWVVYNFVSNVQHFFLEGIDPIKSWRMVGDFKDVVGPLPPDMVVGFSKEYGKVMGFGYDTLSAAANDMQVSKLFGGVGKPIGLFEAVVAQASEGIERTARSSMYVGQFQKNMDEVFGAWIRALPKEAFEGVPDDLVGPLRRQLSRKVSSGFANPDMLDDMLVRFGDGQATVTWNRLADYERAKELLPGWLNDNITKGLDDLVADGAPVHKREVKRVFEEVTNKLRAAEMDEVRHLHTALDDLQIATSLEDLVDDAMRVGNDLKTRQGFLDGLEEVERQYETFLRWAGQELQVTIDAQVSLGTFTPDDWTRILADHRTLVSRQVSNINVAEEELLLRVTKKWGVDPPKEFLQDRAMLRGDLATYFELKDEVFGKASYQASMLAKQGKRREAGLVWEKARKTVAALGGAKVDTELALAQNYQAAFNWVEGLKFVDIGAPDLVFANRREVGEILHDMLEKAPEVHAKYAPHYKELDRWLEEVLTKRMTPVRTMALSEDTQAAITRSYNVVRNKFGTVYNDSFDVAYEKTNEALIDYVRTSNLGNLMGKVIPFWRWPAKNIPYWLNRVTTTSRGRWTALALLDSYNAIRNWNDASGQPPSALNTVPLLGSAKVMKALGIGDGIHDVRIDPFAFISIFGQIPGTPYQRRQLEEAFMGEDGNLDPGRIARRDTIVTLLDSVGLKSWPYVDYVLGMSGLLGDDWYSRDFLPWSRAIQATLYAISDGKWDFNPDRELRAGVNKLVDYFPFMKGNELFSDRWLLYETGKEVKRMVMEGTAQIDAEGNFLDPDKVQKEAQYTALKREAATSILGHLTGFYVKDYHDADYRAYALQSTYLSIKEKGEYPAESHAPAEAREHFFAENPEIFALWEASGTYPWVTKMSDHQKAQMRQFEYATQDWYWVERNAINDHYDAELDRAISTNLADWTTKSLINASRQVRLEGVLAEYQYKLQGKAADLEIEGYADADNLTPFKASLWGKTPDDVQQNFIEQTYRSLFTYMPQRVDYTTTTPDGKTVFDGDAYREAMDYFWDNPMEVLQKSPLWNPTEAKGEQWLTAEYFNQETFDEYSKRNDSKWEALQKVYYEYFIGRGSDQYATLAARNDAGELTEKEWKDGLDALFTGFENIPIGEVIPFLQIDYDGRWAVQELLDTFDGGEYVLPSLTEWWAANDTAREKTIGRLKELYLALGSLDRKRFRSAQPDFSEDLWEDPTGTTTARFMEYIHSIEDALGVPQSAITDAPVWSDEFSARAGGDKVDVTDPNRALRVEIFRSVLDKEGVVTETNPDKVTTITDPGLLFSLANPKDSTEYDTAKELNTTAWELKEAGQNEAAQELFENPLWIKWFGNTPKSTFWRYYLGQIPPGRISETLRADTLIKAIMDKESSRSFISEDGYSAATARIMAWVGSNPDLPGNPAEWALAKDQMSAYMELEKGSDARKEYWAAHPLLEKYWGSGSTSGTGGGSSKAWTQRFGGGTAPRATQTDIWIAVQSSLGPLGLGQLNMHLYQGKKLSPKLESKLRALFNKYGAGWTTFDKWVKEYLRYLLKNRTRFTEPKLQQPRHSRLSLGRMGYEGTTPRSFIRR